jgi:hypothetical protein
VPLPIGYPESAVPVLTHAAIAKYVPHAKRRREIRDHQAPGLYLIVQPKPKGTKSWALRFRRPDGRPAKLTLGSVNLIGEEIKGEPVLGAALTVRQARQLANKIDRERAMGDDVVAVYKAVKLLEHTADASTFGAAVRDYIVDHKTKWGGRARRWRSDAAVLGLRYGHGA